MNFKWMPELEQPYGYPLLMTCMLSLCGYLYGGCGAPAGSSPKL
jgi:Mg2+ and Co2+ transporter CorA